MACLRGKAATARLLVEHGADVTSVDRKEWTPLHFASHGGFIDVVSLLLDRGADVDARSRGVEVTPLHKACENDHVQTAQLLLEHGADVNARDYEGYAPLHSQWLSPHMSQLLLDHNADVNLQDCSGWGPLHHAASRGDTATAEMLLHRAADVHATVWIKGMHVTALHIAAKQSRRGVIRALLKHGDLDSATVSIPYRCPEDEDEDGVADASLSRSTSQCSDEPKLKVGRTDSCS